MSSASPLAGSDADYSMREGDTAAAAAQLSHRFFPNGFCNPGFGPPPYLVDSVAMATIEPPAVVKTWEMRLAELTPAELDAYTTFRAWVVERKWDTGENPIDEWETLRFLIARQYDLKKAKAMLEAHVPWLAQIQPKSVVCGACLKNNAAHMQTFVGWDKLHRPVMYMSYKQCSDRSNADNAMAHNLMIFEQFKQHVMPVGVEQWVAVTDFVTYSHWKDGASGVGRKVLGIIQDHYPERLALQLLVDPPTTFWVLWKTLGRFVDAKTRDKVKMVYTAAEPNIRDEFPKLFPPHVANWLIAKYLDNKGAAPPAAAEAEPDAAEAYELDEEAAAA